MNSISKTFKVKLNKIRGSKLWRKYGNFFTIIFYSLLVLVGGIVIFIVMFYVSNCYLNDYVSKGDLVMPKSLLFIQKGAGSVKAEEFLSAAQWIQILISILGLLVSLFLLNQLAELKYERKRAAAEAMKQLSDDKFREARRILNFDSVSELFMSMPKEYDITVDSSKKMNKDEFNKLFLSLKSNF